tara:strand:- start:296 stop:1174 length:879 start_codon:yes stop_codon:yes gene_type:complete
VTTELFTTFSEEYASIQWLGLEEIEYVLGQPVEDAFQKGLPLYYPLEGWQEISQCDLPVGKLFVNGHCRIHHISKKLFEVESYSGPGSYLERRLYLYCGLYADGFAQFKLSFDVLDHLWIDHNIESLNTEEPPVGFDKEVRTSPYSCPESPPLNYMISKGMVDRRISAPIDAIETYCKSNFVSRYEERIALLQRAAEQTEDEKVDHYYAPAPVYGQSTAASVNKLEDTDQLSTQGRNALTKTARALAKCLVPELSDEPTNEQLNALVKIMEDEHNDIPHTIKTLKKHLTNPE